MTAWCRQWLPGTKKALLPMTAPDASSVLRAATTPLSTTNNLQHSSPSLNITCNHMAHDKDIHGILAPDIQSTPSHHNHCKWWQRRFLERAGSLPSASAGLPTLKSDSPVRLAVADSKPTADRPCSGMWSWSAHSVTDFCLAQSSRSTSARPCHGRTDGKTWKPGWL